MLKRRPHNRLGWAVQWGTVRMPGTFPRLSRLRKAVATMASALSVLMDTPPAGITAPDAPDGDATEAGRSRAGALSVAQAWELIERVVPRQQLVKALAELNEMLPEGGDPDADAGWRAQLLERYATVRGFVALLAEVVPWGVTRAGAPIAEALRQLPRVQAQRKPAAEHIDVVLLADGGRRRPVLGNPHLAPGGLIDEHAWTFCVLEALHVALKRRDVFARGADAWGDPRARLLSGAAWQVNRPRVLAALELPGNAAEHLAEMELLLEETYRHMADGLAGNASVEIVGGKIRQEKLGPEPEPEGLAVSSEIRSRLSPLVCDHINFHGRYPIVRSHQGRLAPAAGPERRKRSDLAVSAPPSTAPSRIMPLRLRGVSVELLPRGAGGARATVIAW
ncbi:hypothetical protein ACFYY8_18045 [Streptosporangium sp. NPDC001559]|uniref:hypothetical protein n=1 Tax=Streptosporangium sp. NPDC001559 TaxID=3366187 RepID=UPI0036EE1E9B